MNKKFDPIEKEDVLDSRDLQERIDYLESFDEEELDDSEKEELESLKELKEESDFGEWDWGQFFIKRGYWVEYCENMVKDIGDLPRELPSYIQNNIDWDGVADDIEQDYSVVNFGREEYLTRS